MEEDSKVLITGGAGFIGQHLARRFADLILGMLHALINQGRNREGLGYLIWR